jgi:hypothetical protein
VHKDHKHLIPHSLLPRGTLLVKKQPEVLAEKSHPGTSALHYVIKEPAKSYLTLL